MVVFLYMWSKSKSQYRNDLMKYHRNVDHTPLKNSSNLPTLSDQLNENSKRILENIKDTPAYEVDFPSKTFNQIRIKEIPYEWYTSQDIENFFTSFDYADEVYVFVDTPARPYIDKYSSLVSVVSATSPRNRETLHADLFRYCLPHEIRQQYVSKKDHFLRLQALLDHYGRKIIIRKRT